MTFKPNEKTLNENISSNNKISKRNNKIEQLPIHTARLYDGTENIETKPIIKPILKKEKSNFRGLRDSKHLETDELFDAVSSYNKEQNTNIKQVREPEKKDRTGRKIKFSLVNEVKYFCKNDLPNTVDEIEKLALQTIQRNSELPYAHIRQNKSADALNTPMAENVKVEKLLTDEKFFSEKTDENFENSEKLENTIEMVEIWKLMKVR
jgi:hypothetical protein